MTSFVALGVVVFDFDHLNHAPCKGNTAKKITRTTRSNEMNIGNIIDSSKHHKQQAFFENDSRNRWIFGGNRTGKTHAGAIEVIRRTTKNTCEGWVVSLSNQVQRDVAQRKILELLDECKIEYECVMINGKAKSPKHGVIDFITLDNQSRIGFKNCEQGREKFQGVKLDFIWFDEEPPEDIYDECLIRTMDNMGFIWGTMTPLKGRTWVHERIFVKSGQDDIWTDTWTWEDNPYLPNSEKSRMEKMYSTESLESRKYGRFLEGTGLVFKEFNDENIIKGVSVSSQMENFVYTGISIDPGYVEPTAIVWLGIDRDENIFVIDEYKESERSIEQLSETIKQKSRELGVEIKNVFIDSNSTQHTLGLPQTVADKFQSLGIPVNARVDKSVHDGLHTLKGLFGASDGTKKLFIYEHCTALVSELRGYFWGDNNRPVKKNDHLIDALRYIVMSRSETSKVNTVSKYPRQTTKPDKFEKHKRSIIHGNKF